MVPIDVPGDSVPPLSIVVDETVPVPASVPPELTVAPLDDAIDPFTASVPALMGTPPAKVLLPVRTVVPVPSCVTAPLPEMLPPKVNVSERLKLRTPLLKTLPRIDPEAPPLPSCSTPAVIVVSPV